MKLTRRDFLKGSAITALALAVGVKPKTSGGYVTKMPAIDTRGYILPEKLAVGIRSHAHYGWPQDTPYHPNCCSVDITEDRPSGVRMKG